MNEMIGKKAPEFKLLNQNNELVKLSDYKNKSNVIVYFYPKAMTPGCTVQAKGISSIQNKLKKLDVTVLAISADPVERLKKFEMRDDLNLQLLSDPENKVAKLYESFGEKKFMGKVYDGILRQTYYIDKKGKLIYQDTKVNTKTHHDKVLDLINELF